MLELVLLNSHLPYLSQEPTITAFLSPNEIASFEKLFLIGVIIFFAVAVLRYMFAKIFSDEQGVVKAKAEILDSIAVALLWAGLFLLFKIIEWLATIFYPFIFTPTEGTIGFIESYLRPLVFDNMNSAFLLAMKNARLASNYLKEGGTTFSIFSYPILGDPSFSSIKRGNELIIRASIDTSIAVGLSVAYSALGYIKDSMGYFLIFGLILRVIPFFRAAGSFLIALSIGFYYVYPITTAMFFFGVPKLILEDKEEFFVEADQAFCKLVATSALILPEQQLVRGFNPTLGEPQSIEEDLGLILSTEFLISQIVSLSLTAIFINNFSLILSKGIYTGADIGSLLNRLI